VFPLMNPHHLFQWTYNLVLIFVFMKLIDLLESLKSEKTFSTFANIEQTSPLFMFMSQLKFPFFFALVIIIV